MQTGKSVLLPSELTNVSLNTLAPKLPRNKNNNHIRTTYMKLREITEKRGGGKSKLKFSSANETRIDSLLHMDINIHILISSTVLLFYDHATDKAII